MGAAGRPRDGGAAEGRAGEHQVDADTRLATVERGTGANVVLLPGWSQTAALFGPLMATLADDHHLVAVDHRGHGRSTTPPTGYHLHRLAADVHSLLEDRDLGEVHLVGHSMGCAVIWSYLELYGTDRLASLVLIDQMPCALRNPAWSDDEALAAGATMDAAGLFAFTDALRGEGDDPRPGFLEAVTSAGITDDELAWLVEENQGFDRTHAAELIFDVATHDWRPLLPHVALPTLVVAGDSPNVPLASQLAMAEAIPGATSTVIPGRDGGSHFPFVERPAEVAAAIADHVGRP